MPYRRKLIEVALPLEAINIASAREKSIRHGHPSTLHLWWARRPLAACRAVLFSQLVDDPGEYMPDEESANEERQRLFKIIEDLVQWENTNNEEVLDKARLEIARSVARDLGVDVPVGKQAIREFLATQAPPVLDPFAGGGSIPLEAQRLGLRAYASDLNPVAVLINKALIEIPPKFAGLPPVHPQGEASAAGKKSKRKGAQADASPQLWAKDWQGAEGLAEDVRYYGQWMRDEAYKRIGHLYPPVKITEEILAERADLKAQGLKAGDELTVIAWLWARTVKCPNPACGCQMPLVRSFALCTQKGKQAWVEPTISRKSSMPAIHFNVKTGGMGSVPIGTVIRTGARCLACETPVPFDHVRAEGQSDRMGTQMMAIVAEGKKGRIYLPPNNEHILASTLAEPKWGHDTELPEQALGFRVQLYGLKRHNDLFSQRQLTALTTFTDLINDVNDAIQQDYAQSNFEHSSYSLLYQKALSVYLTFALDRGADKWATLAIWNNIGEKVEHVFGRQTMSMTWDFAEGNPFSESTGNWISAVEWVAKALEKTPASGFGMAIQQDATSLNCNQKMIFSTDPPYYDNVPYADLSDFFYIWLRRSLSTVYPDLFSTLLVPKVSELIAEPFRHGGSKKARIFFEDGLEKVFRQIYLNQIHSSPLTVYYAFKQAEYSEAEDYGGNASIASTGWETMLEGLIHAGFSINGTWPIRTEQGGGLRLVGRNSLASSIVLVCRPRQEEIPNLTRRDFLAILKKEFPLALRQLQQGNIAPVDLAQVAIGPGMAVFSRYKQVLEADGSPMRVRTALGLINQALDEFLAEQEGEYDTDTRWALAWYEQYAHETGPYGVAETLSKAKNTSVEGLVEASLLEARAGKVRLLRREELDPEWDPQKDKRPTAWEACQHLIYNLETGGEQTAAVLLAEMGGLSEMARDLAYRLYTVCERKGWAQEALGYNMLVVAWPRLRELAARKEAGQARLL